MYLLATLRQNSWQQMITYPLHAPVSQCSVCRTQHIKAITKQHWTRCGRRLQINPAVNTRYLTIKLRNQGKHTQQKIKLQKLVDIYCNQPEQIALMADRQSCTSSLSFKISTASEHQFFSGVIINCFTSSNTRRHTAETKGSGRRRKTRGGGKKC